MWFSPIVLVFPEWVITPPELALKQISRGMSVDICRGSLRDDSCPDVARTRAGSLCYAKLFSDY
jgi:hypothetical protein